jgi:PASTA domain
LIPREEEMDWLIDRLLDQVHSRLRSIIPLDAIDIVGMEGTGPGPPGRATVPDVRGLAVSEARSALAREGFRVASRRLERRPAPVMGTVVDQSPAPGTRLRRGRRVTISVRHPQRALRN